MRRVGVVIGGLVLGMALSLLPSGPAHAQGIPVIDIQGLFQSLLQAERALAELDQLAKQYEKQIEQLSVAIEQRDALLGSRGAGSLLNGPEAQAARRALPGTLEALLRLAETGDVSLAELRGLYAAREDDLELSSMDQIGSRSEPGRTSRAYERTRRATLANLAVSEKAYDDAARRIVTYEALLRAIDQTQDLKASADLASRIDAENGLVLNELVRLQSLQMATQASAGANELVGRSNLSEFSSFDEEKFDELARSLRVRTAQGQGPADVSIARRR